MSSRFSEPSGTEEDDGVLNGLSKGFTICELLSRIGFNRV